MLVEVSRRPRHARSGSTTFSRCKEDPNENFARELLELFALGIGNYTEEDINEIARCFTGWTLRESPSAPGGFQATFLPAIHDTGSKTVLGQTVRAGQGPEADGRQVCQILADHPVCARFLAGKLWAYFAAGPLPEPVQGRMTAAYAANAHSIGEMLRAMFLSEEFYAPTVSDQQIKSPYELIAGTMRTLEVDSGLFLEADTLLLMLYLVDPRGDRHGADALPAAERQGLGRRTQVDQHFDAPVPLQLRHARSRPSARFRSSTRPRSSQRSGATTAEEIVDYFLALLGPLDVGAAADDRLVTYMYARDDGTPRAISRSIRRRVDTKVRGLLKLLLSTAEYQMHLKGPDPGLVVPLVVSPLLQNGKLLLTAAGSNIQQGALLRVTGDGVAGTETFALARNAKGTKWVVGKRARARRAALRSRHFWPRVRPSRSSSKTPTEGSRRRQRSAAEENLMAYNRRQFIRRGITFVGAGLAAPRLLLAPGGGVARAQGPGGSDRILVIVELEGGNDGLNTIVPYTDSLYYSNSAGARPARGRSTSS